MEHSSEFLAIVDDAMTRVRELGVTETLERLKSGAHPIDVREYNEFEAAHAVDSRHEPGHHRPRSRADVS